MAALLKMSYSRVMTADTKLHKNMTSEPNFEETAQKFEIALKLSKWRF
jgi:hypothetical protein